MEFKQITNITKEKYSGEVFDLSVEGAHSYNIDGLIVHNSGGGSLVSYALGITQFDPLEYGLLFERFLNIERGKMPDIDSDFCESNVHKVLNYIVEKYGKEHTCSIATFGSMKTKMVIKDIAKTMEIPFEEVNEFTKKLGKEDGSVEELYQNSEHRKFFDKHPGLYEHAKQLEGMPRHVSQHPAGICITPLPVTDIAPVLNAKDDSADMVSSYLCQFEKEQVEKAGLVKFDILRLSNLTEIAEQIKNIKRIYNVDIDVSKIKFDDKKTWDLIDRGDSLGVFQMSSYVAVPLLKRIKPQCIEELSVVNSFIRPGSSGLEEYLEGKGDPKRIRKLDPRIDKHLAVTYGAIVYQEQIMQLISELMGISFGQADIYRRALEAPDKPKNAKYVEEFNREVVNRAEKLGYNISVADKIRQLIIENSGYGFNKCLSGSEKIYGYDLSIKEMFNGKNSNQQHNYGYAFSKNQDGIIIKNKIVDIYYSGVKDIYKVKTTSGKTVQCTLNHKFPTPQGDKLLSELTSGDNIYVFDECDVLNNASVKIEKIKKIVFVETEDVYDVEMTAPNHNLLMSGGVVVANSHSIAYSIISYWTAYLKANFPTIFYTAMFNGKLDKMSAFLVEARKNGINIIPPNVSISKFTSEVNQDGSAIIIGFNAIKGVGPAAVDSIISCQPFSSINDFIDRCDGRTVNKKVIESLIKSGSFEGLPILTDQIEGGNVTLNREQLFRWYELYLEANAEKSINNYMIPIEYISMRYRESNEFIIDLNDEKKECVILPEPFLEEFNIKLKDEKENYKTRKKPKGKFKINNENKKKISPFDKPFLNEKDSILSIQFDPVSSYIQETENLGFSFIKHPFECFVDKIIPFENVSEDAYFKTCGIITSSLEDKKTKTGGNYYVTNILTPFENIKVYLWSSDKKKFGTFLNKNSLIKIRAKKKMGGITIDQIFIDNKTS